MSRIPARPLHLLAAISLAFRGLSPAAEVPAGYTALDRDGSPSPAFSVEHRGALCVITTTDPAAAPRDARSVFSSAGGPRIDTAQARTYRHGDIAVFIVPGANSPHSLAYEPAFTLKSGEALVALSPQGKRIEGKLLYHPGNGGDYSSSFGSVRLLVITAEESADYLAGSGWPVFSMESGRLVGTVVARPSVMPPHQPAEVWGQFDFEPLCLPTGEKPEPRPRDSYGGLKLAQPLDESEFRWLLPACLWDVGVGIQRDELVRKRGALDGLREPYRDHTFLIRDDTPVCYEVQYLTGGSPRVGRPKSDPVERDRITEIELSGNTNPVRGEHAKAERFVAVLEKAFGKPRLFSRSWAPQDRNHKQFIAHWILGERSMTLRLTNELLGVSARIVISETRRTSLLDQIWPLHQPGEAPPSLVAAYKEWIAEQKKIRSDGK